MSAGRKLSPAVVDSIAQGRVWTGQKALEIGLVDKLGNIDDAIKCAAGMARLKEYKLKEYPEKKSFFDKIFNKYENEVKTRSIKEEIGVEQYTLLQKMKSYRAMMNVPQAKMAYEISFR